MPLQWPTTQNNLGDALRALGKRESGTETLLEAYGEALTRERVPLDWAMTQNNIGSALTRFGERDRGTEALQKAVQAHGEALKEWTKDAAPYWHNIVQQNLDRANALLTQGRGNK